jgi:hypothetical protein
MKKLTLLLGVLLFISCYTDGNDIDNSLTTEIQLLRNIYIDNNLSYSFDYYPDGKIMSQSSFSGNGIYGFALFEYSNDTVIKTLSGLIASKTKSYLTSSNTIKYVEFDLNDNINYSYLNKYSSENCGLTKSITFTQYNQLYTIVEYEYKDSNCSYNSIIELYDGSLKYRYETIKDDKHNYLKSLNPWSSFEKKHNIIEYNAWDQNDNLMLSNSYNSIFIYDENGYPIQETRTSLSGVTKVYNYEYY